VNIDVHVDQSVLNNSILNVGINLDAKLLQTAAQNEKDVNVAVKDETGKEMYSWRFDGKALADSDKVIGDVDLALKVEKVADNSVLKDLLKSSKDTENPVQGLIVDFSHDGVLPAEAEVRIFVGDLVEKNEEGKYINSKIYLYHYNPTTGKLETLPFSSAYKVNQDGYITINILHCSDYVALPKQADTGVITSLRDQITVEINKLTLTLSKDKTATIMLNLPSTLELVAALEKETSGDAVGAVTVTYTSSDKKIATVDKNGKITAKAIGKAYIYATVTLYSNKTKTMKVAVTVKK